MPMYRTEDPHFAAYLHAQQIAWLSCERNDKGRTDFLFDLTNERAMTLRVQYANSPESRFALSLDFVTRLVQDARRNNGRNP